MSRMEIHFIVFGFVLKGSPDFSYRGDREDDHGGKEQTVLLVAEGFSGRSRSITSQRLCDC